MTRSIRSKGSQRNAPGSADCPIGKVVELVRLVALSEAGGDGTGPFRGVDCMACVDCMDCMDCVR